MDPTEGISRELYNEHLGALDVLRHAKNVFFWLAVVAVVLHAVSWVIATYTDALEPLSPVAGDHDGGAGFEAVPTEAELNAARRWELAIESALVLGGFVGRASALVLTGVFLLAMLVSLSVRLGGATNLAKACVWSLVALAMLVPWLHAPEEVVGAGSAFYGLDELNRAAVSEPGTAGGLLSAVRFLVCPILVAVFLFIALVRFHTAYGQITAAPGARLPIREV
ncbi:MAG: hypothetical protein JXQ75_07485 [Phycisphaerae bacterium]|nr:hypothetical protein [Phycisphaerae bacterium]